MARNEEKQLGKLNRLWLQKERDAGRIKDVHERRPKLATLNSATAVKKWIPSIKKEIEYYLQQSQLSHYPERKIEEFRLHIEELEREYKRYVTKLRSLDPACKHKPWEPRAYTKRRRETISGPSTSKKTCLDTLIREEEVNEDTNPEENHTLLNNIRQLCTPSASEPLDQDALLCFDQSRLAVAVASSRVALAGQQQDTGMLTRVLFCGLPNLHSLPLAQTAAQERTQQPSDAETQQRKSRHLLGLDCYSSSSEEEI